MNKTIVAYLKFASFICFGCFVTNTEASPPAKGSVRVYHLSQKLPGKIRDNFWTTSRPKGVAFSVLRRTGTAYAFDVKLSALTYHRDYYSMKPVHWSPNTRETWSKFKSSKAIQHLVRVPGADVMVGAPPK